VLSIFLCPKRSCNAQVAGPPLMGRSAEERAVIEFWLRRIEWGGIYAAQEAFRNATPGLKGRALSDPVSLEQIPALAERGRLRVQHFFAWLDARLADNEFVCGPHFSIADISGMVAVDFSAWAKLTPPEHLGHLQRWHKDSLDAAGRQSLTFRGAASFGMLPERWIRVGAKGSRQRPSAVAADRNE
jgi:glutathione S-transferase